MEKVRWGEREYKSGKGPLLSQIISKHLVTVTSVAVITLLPTLRISNSLSSKISHVEQTQRTKRLLLQDFLPEYTGETERGWWWGAKSTRLLTAQLSTHHHTEICVQLITWFHSSSICATESLLHYWLSETHPSEATASVPNHSSPSWAASINSAMEKRQQRKSLLLSACRGYHFSFLLPFIFLQEFTASILAGLPVDRGNEI